MKIHEQTDNRKLQEKQNLMNKTDNGEMCRIASSR